MASHRYWKLNILNNALAGAVQIAELGLFNTGGGPIRHGSVLTDSSPNGLNATGTGAVTLNTSPAQFGGQSFGFTSNTAYWSIDSTAAIVLASGDWTIKGWVRVPTITNQRLLNKDGRFNVSNPQYQIYTNGSGMPILGIGSGDGVSSSQVFTGTTALVANTWAFLELTRVGSTMYGWIDGAALFSPTTITATMSDGGTPLRIGAFPDGSGAVGTGYWQDLRILKVGGNTSSYTPPTDMQPVGVDDPAWLAVSLALRGDGYIASTNLAPTITASSSATTTSGSTANLFDGNTATSWTGGSAKPEFILFNFASAVDIDAFSVTNKLENFLTYARLDGSDNNITFTPVIWTGQITAGEDEISNHLTAPFPDMQGDATLPALRMVGVAGWQASLSLPALQMTGAMGGSGVMELPALRIAGQIRPARDGGAMVLPMLTIEARTGHRGALVLPALQFTGSGVIMGTVSGDLALPALQIAASISGGAAVSAALQLPALRFAGQFGGAMRGLLPALRFEGAMRGGAVLAGALRLPALRITAQISDATGLRAELILPALRMVPFTSGAMALPALRLEGAIREVVTIAYEAYVLSLHPVGKAEVLPVTRYTNWPFDEVVRLGNTYYGIAADGIYALGGDTDHAEPEPIDVAWSWRTALTDFGMVEKKTVPSVYLGGRFGRQMELDWQVGETRDVVYRYRSTRDATAQTVREKFGRGLKARYYALGASGEGEFELDTVDFDVAKLSRRI